MVLISVCGKANSGKTTFFSAATLVDAEISSRVFTTVKPNRGVSYVRTDCVCRELNVTCSPGNSKCINGTRLVPVKLIDIAGLVPGAHEGRGLGNQFLSDIMGASALIHIVDMSGGTDSEGNIVEPGTHNPMEDIEFLKKEIDYWILSILKKNWPQLMRKAEVSKKGIEEVVTTQLTGLGVTSGHVKEAMKAKPITGDSTDEEMLEFIEALRGRSKPILIAANKIDVPAAGDLFSKVKSAGIDAVPCSAESELALRRAAEKGLIKYLPGDPDFETLKETDEQQKKALEFIKERVLSKYGSTGIQEAMNKAVFETLDMIVAYPVASSAKLSDTKGRVLPDAFLVRKGTTLQEFASKVHSDIADKFLGGIDARTKRKLGADYELQDRDVVEILFRR